MKNSPNQKDLISKRRTIRRSTILILLTSFWISYAVNDEQNKHQMAVDARRVSLIISEPFEWFFTLSTHMGKTIIENDKVKDLKFINNLFQETYRLHGSKGSLISWSAFSWSDIDQNLSVNALDGIIKNPENLGSRSYTWSAAAHPWRMQITKAEKGMISNTLVLPLAMGIANKKEAFQGTIVSGINVKELLSRAEMVMNSSNSFLVLNRDYSYVDRDKIILSSANAPVAAEGYKKSQDLSSYLRDWMDPTGKSPIIIDAGRFRYSYYSLVESLPLAIIIGFDRWEFWGKVLVLGSKITVGFLAFIFLIRNYYKRVKGS